MHETLLSFCRLYLCNNSNNLLNIKLLTILFTSNYLLSDFADQEGGNPEQQVAPAAAHEDGEQQAPAAANREDGEQQAPAATNPRKP